LISPRRQASVLCKDLLIQLNDYVGRGGVVRTIVTPSDLPQYVPGEIWLDAVDGRWSGLSIRGYKYKPSDISAPGCSDYLIVLYTGGPTRMSRRVDGPRRTSDVAFGDISLLTRAVESEWCWQDSIEVLHIYLEITGLCRALRSIRLETPERQLKPRADWVAPQTDAATLPSASSSGPDGMRL
jgi:AraC family transcriptional regulator